MHEVNKAVSVRSSRRACAWLENLRNQILIRLRLTRIDKQWAKLNIKWIDLAAICLGFMASFYFQASPPPMPSSAAARVSELHWEICFLRSLSSELRRLRRVPVRLVVRHWLQDTVASRSHHGHMAMSHFQAPPGGGGAALPQIPQGLCKWAS